MKKLLVGLFLSCYACVLLAQAPELKKGHPDTYYVKTGDTLWDISNVFLQDPWMWPEIWHINPQVSNPHLIFPGDKLALVYVSNKDNQEVPKLTVVERAPVKLTPAMGKITPGVRSTAVTSAIPAIPLERINAFLTKSRVVNLGVLNAAPYVLAGDKGHIVSGAGDKIYARGEFAEGEKVFGIYRQGEIYFDPETEEALGVQARDIGDGRVLAFAEDVATLIVNRSNEEIRINDRLLLTEEKTVTATFYPKSPNKDVKGFIIAVEGGVTQVGAMDIVALNQGERDGLAVGDVLAIDQAGEVVKDRVKNELIQLPDVKAGLLIVFRTFDKMAFGLVVTAHSPLRTGDKVRNPY